MSIVNLSSIKLAPLNERYVADYQIPSGNSSTSQLFIPDTSDEIREMKIISKSNYVKFIKRVRIVHNAHAINELYSSYLQILEQNGVIDLTPYVIGRNSYPAPENCTQRGFVLFFEWNMRDSMPVDFFEHTTIQITKQNAVRYKSKDSVLKVMDYEHGVGNFQDGETKIELYGGRKELQGVLIKSSIALKTLKLRSARYILFERNALSAILKHDMFGFQTLNKNAFWYAIFFTDDPLGSTKNILTSEMTECLQLFVTSDENFDYEVFTMNNQKEWV